MSRGLALALWLVVLSGTASVAGAQAPSTGVATPATEAAAHVHEAGGYPDEISVIDDESDQSARGAGSEGAGGGPTGRIGVHGDRDGGAPADGLDFPVPDFVQDILHALGALLGVAARPLGYVLFAFGVAVVIALVVYLLVMMRLPRADLRGTVRRRGNDAPDAMLDPLLTGSDASAEDHTANGRYREAIHALFLRALREATRAGDVDRRGRTAREVVRLVEGVHGALPPLAALLSLTELVWFGGRPAIEAQYLEARELADAVAVGARIPRSSPATQAAMPS
jgi:hypothetical protein